MPEKILKMLKCDVLLNNLHRDERHKFVHSILFRILSIELGTLSGNTTLFTARKP